jgi:hypothetical protein
MFVFQSNRQGMLEFDKALRKYVDDSYKKTNKMKQNKKETVNIVELIEGYVDNINKVCEEHQMTDLYKLTIGNSKVKGAIKLGADKDKGLSRTLKLIHMNLETKERTILYSNTFTFKNPSEALTVDYKRQLCKRFFYDAFSILAVTIKSNMDRQKAEQLLKTPKAKVEDMEVKDMEIIKDTNEA